MKTVIPICTECGNELRQEHLVDEDNHGYMSGYCNKCAKHFRLCGRVRYMNHCIKLQNHDGEHQDSEDYKWNGEFHK